MAYKLFVMGGYWFTHTNTQLPISKINVNLFTHLFCCHVRIDSQTYELSISESTKLLMDQFSKTVKEKNSEVKILLSIGGDDAKANRIALMAVDSSHRATFIRSLISKARAYNFDGVDLQWLYPSSMEEMANFGALINECFLAIFKEARESRQPRLILVATVFYLPYVGIAKYPTEIMRRTLDWANVIAYDIYTPTSSDNETGPSSALFNPERSSFCGYFGMRTWIEKGMPTKRMIFGLPFHGWAWTLRSPKNHNVYSPAYGPALGRYHISTKGLIEYRDIKKFIADNDANNVPIDPKFKIAYTHCDYTWIAYESEETIIAKLRRVKINLAMLGYFASNIAADDDNNSLAKEKSRWPLVVACAILLSICL